MAVDFKEILKEKILDLSADQLAHKLDVPYEMAVWLKEIIQRHYTKTCTSLRLFERRYNDRTDQEFKPPNEEKSEPADNNLFVEGGSDLNKEET